MVDILLIQPPIRDFYLTAKRTMPYGLACIASALIESGFSVQIFDGLATGKSRVLDLPPEMDFLNEYYGKPDRSPFSLFHHYRHFGYSFEHIGKVARESGAFLVGIACLFTAYSSEVLRTAEMVKKFYPPCHIVLGGHHPTVLPETAMACEAVDFILRGEGEVSMPQLARAIKTGDSIKSIPGIVYRRADGTLRVSPPTTMVDPDRYPLPAMHLLKHDFYKREKSACTVITASRGCPMKCSYCCIGSGSVVTYRRRSVNRIVAEIEHAVAQFNVGFIDFEDENLSLEKKWFLTLLRELKTRIKRPGLELRAMNGLFPPSLDDEIVYAMRQAGFKILNLSLGSTCRPQLKKFCRPDVRDAFEKALGLAEKYGLKAVGYVIAGAPDQRAADSVADLLYLASHRVLAGVSIFYPAPGSSDFDLCKEFGILPDGFSLMRSSTLPLSHTTTRIESVTLMRLGRILNFTKSLVDQGLNIPKPLPFCKDAILNNMDRTETGQQLLRWFLHDGIIRGVTQSGEIYEHKTSRKLTQMFIEALKSIRIKGYETSQTG